MILDFVVLVLHVRELDGKKENYWDIFHCFHFVQEKPKHQNNPAWNLTMN